MIDALVWNKYTCVGDAISVSCLNISPEKVM